MKLGREGGAGLVFETWLEIAVNGRTNFEVIPTYLWNVGPGGPSYVSKPKIK
jgi:hypothetical protein